MLTDNAVLLLNYLTKKGGGILPESMILDALGFSHGTFSALRRELIKEGCLQIDKNGRQAVYVLLTKDSALESTTVEEPQVAAEPPGAPIHMQAAGKVVSAPSQTPLTSTIPEPAVSQTMPHIIGDFCDLDEWQDELAVRLGGCLDISETLVSGEYHVYSHALEAGDIYHVTENEQGGVSVS